MTQSAWLSQDWGRWPIAEWRKAQAELRLQHLRYLIRHSPYYQRQLAGLELAAAATNLDQVWQQLPRTSKEDLARVNDEFLVPTANPVDCCLTSGTTGAPVTLWQNPADLERLALNEALALGLAGITSQDRVLVGAALDRCFMAGLAYFLGVKRIGGVALRVGAAPPVLVAELIERLHPTSIIGVPSLLRQIGEEVRNRNAEALSGVQRLVCIGEPIREANLELSSLGYQLSEIWGAPQLHATYASTELATSFCECPAGCGGHLLPQLCHLELTDEDGKPVDPGQIGEIVVTPLGVQTMPLLRYRTGDLAQLHTAPCDCGRTTPRLGPVLGRKAQMLKVQGTTLFPQAIFSVVQAFPAIREYCLVVDADFALSDRPKLLIAGEGEFLEKEVEQAVRARTRVTIAIERRPLEEIRRLVIQPKMRKPVRFIDRRQNKPSFPNT